MRNEKWFATSSDTDADYYICEKKGNSVHSVFIKNPFTTTTEQPTTESRTPEILVISTGKVKQPANLPLLAILLIIIPIAIIAALVLLVKKGQLNIQPLLQRLKPKKEKKENKTEEPGEPVVESEQPYYISTNTAIAVKDLENYNSSTDNIIKMHLEFQSIPPTMGLPQTIANKPINKTKNRFKDIKPYDANRVVLSEIPGIENSDYINASLIDGYEHPKLFIASCGPTNHTMGDFWRMIWEHKVKCVIMLTQLMEGAKEMCKQYWPKLGGASQQYGDLHVTLEQEDKFTDFKCRHLKVKKGGEERNIVQLHIESWMDMRILDTAVEILNLRKEMRKFIFSECPPILLHCRAGVGRTGTFVALDYLLMQAEKEGIVDVAKCVANLRNQRVKLVQNVDQYEFLYQAVTEGVLLGNTCILHSNFLKAFSALMKPRPSGSSKFDYEFKLMNDSSSVEEKPTKGGKFAGLQTINKLKNRNKNIVADDSYRISLVTKSEGRNDYINAVAVDNLDRSCAFIATQAPLQGTAIDFWRAIWDWKCGFVVMLCCQEQLDATEIYYPEVEDENYAIPPFDIKCSSIVTKKHILIKELSLSLSQKRAVFHLSVTSDLKLKSSKELMAIFLSIYSTIKSRKTKSSQKAPTFVHCLDGAEWTGMFCAFSCLLDQIESDKEVDVFQAARLVRRSRPQFISTKEQYRKLYEMTSYYIRKPEGFSEDTEETKKPGNSKKTSDSVAVDIHDVLSPTASDTSSVSNEKPEAIYVNAKVMHEL